MLNPQAKEDAEVLRSLVIPLEEEINALKEKLRANDQQLRKYQAVSQYLFCHLNIFLTYVIVQYIEYSIFTD